MNESEAEAAADAADPKEPGRSATPQSVRGSDDKPTSSSSSSSSGPGASPGLRAVLANLAEVETALQSVLETHRHGTHGFLTREWGFTAPGGLGGKLGGRFRPWELKLEGCREFFWPVACYESMEVGPDFGRPDPSMVEDLPPEGEQLYGNTPLHLYLGEAPVPSVELAEEDYRDYREAARIFLLLGTLSHLYGNSAPNGPKTAELPGWIEDPLLVVAERLGVEPTLSGHFLVQENWTWKGDKEEPASEPSLLTGGPNGDVLAKTAAKAMTALSKRRFSKQMARKMERVVVAALLRQCECEDRTHRAKVHPDCFLGTQCVDVVLENSFTDTREEAVRLLRKINRAYNLFQHVSNNDNNYELMDDRGFYRFRREWKTRRLMAVSGQSDELTIDDSDRLRRGINAGDGGYDESESLAFSVVSNASNLPDNGFDSNPSSRGSSTNAVSTKAVAKLSVTYSNERMVPRKHTSMYERMAVIHAMAKVRVKDRRYRLRIYKKCFVGKQMIDLLMDEDVGPTRRDCLEIAIAINQQLKLFEHVKKHHLLRDKHLFYRFTNAFWNLVEGETHASTLVQSGRPSNLPGRPMPPLAPALERSGSYIRRPSLPSESSMRSIGSAAEFLDENLRQTSQPQLQHYSDYGDAYDDIFLGEEEATEFGLDNIVMLYPAFGNNHERINQLVPACMGFSLSSLPFDVLDILSVMRNIIEAELVGASDDGDNYEINRLYELVYKVAFSVSKCKEEFQQMSTDPKKRTFNSKYVSIKQTQPLSNGVLVRKTKNGKPEPAKGTTGTQFPYFHILDWLLGRYQFRQSRGSGQNPTGGLVSAVGSIDNTFPRPQREYIRCLSRLQESSSLRGFLDVIGRPRELLTAYNHLIECYAGEGGMLQAHCRKLYSYIHNNVQSSTSGTNHLASKGDAGDSESKSEPPSGPGCPMAASASNKTSSPGQQSGCPVALSSLSNEKPPSERTGCPMATSSSEGKEPPSQQSGCPMTMSSNDSLNAIDNHKFAITMFKHMREAANDRWRLRLPPLMNEVTKIIYSTSESGGFTTVALDLSGTGLLYEYGDVVKVILPNDDRQTRSWLHSLKSMNQEYFKLEDMRNLQKSTGNGWGWDGLWEALGWGRFEEHGGSGVPLEMIARYIEQGNIRDESSKKFNWVHSPLDLSVGGASQMFASPPPIPTERIGSLEPVSPRIYSVSGVEPDRVFLLVSKPDDLARHHGYAAMSDPKITKVHCSFSPATFFLVPPKDVNLVCVASGTGISPFVGLVDSIRSRTGSYTIVHQCKSSDMFMCNSQTWLDFTAMNPGAIVMGYISGDRSRRNCPMRYVIRNGAFEETTVLRRRRISAYYFECESFQSRLLETYKSNGLNLAYCCGGVKSAIMPLRTFTESCGMQFEFTCESYGVSPTLTKESNLLSQIGGTIIDLNHVSPIHPGGDQILHQATDIMTAMAKMKNSENTNTPDHSIAFYELHPHAYNLHRCLRTPVDADAKAFAQFLERQAMSKSVLGNMAMKYAQAVLSSPESSKIVKIATELQSSAISAQLSSGDTESAQKSASYLKELLNHVPESDADSERWGESLSLIPPVSRKSSSVFRSSTFSNKTTMSGGEALKRVSFLQEVSLKSAAYEDSDDESWGESLSLMLPSRRKSSSVLRRQE
ncbi:unnamed protein product [Pseudo-nitzschia multistriata]|uniref:DEP domain-containing protein n=1 Tax=Pseudo-nitzschia multistriata TaxID=183589 RepID=A0A448ZMG9_9STRA|nr:unnamed protein product [Pseudo-nitzschia multistriata]